MIDYGFYNMDCMEGMKQFPDKYFDLAIVDPPYGISITQAHQISASSTKLIGGAADHSAERVARVYGESTKALATQNFIIRSTIPRRRTGNISKRCYESQSQQLSGEAISFWIISARQHA